MQVQIRVLACCECVSGNIWRIFWIEHGKPRSKVIESEDTPVFETFSQIKRKREVPEKEVMKKLGIRKKKECII